jgi:hypothetical protein
VDNACGFPVDYLWIQVDIVEPARSFPQLPDDTNSDPQKFPQLYASADYASNNMERVHIRGFWVFHFSTEPTATAVYSYM